MMPRHSKNLLALLLLFALSLSLGLPGTVHAMPPVERLVLPNQLTLLVVEEHSLPFVTFQLLVHAGSWMDPKGQEGLANLTSKALFLGTNARSATAIDEALDFMGASLDTWCGQDYATVTLKVLTKDVDEGFGLFLETLTQPTFPDAEVRRETEKVLGTIRSAEDDPGTVAERAFQEALYAQGPYGHPVEGTREAVSRITPEAVRRFYATAYHPNRSILAVVGDITVEEVSSRIVPLLARWPSRQTPEPTFTSSFAQGPKTLAIGRPLTQANIILGHGGIARENPDFYAVSVMNYILGSGGFDSRLVEEIRVKRGLAYAVMSFFAPYKHPGSFQIVLQTKNDSAAEAISIAVRQMERMQQEPVSEKELETAKRYLVGSFPLRFDTQNKLAAFLTQVEFFELGLDYPERYPSLIGSVTRDDVLRVAKTHLRPENAIRVVVADLKEAGME